MESDRTICEACLPDAQKVSDEALNVFLNENRTWKLLDDDVQKLGKSYKFQNFINAQGFTSSIGDMAEKEGHHPTIILEYGMVTVSWWSHKIKGLHNNDLLLSLKTDEIYEVCPK
jgi:4a-hydroxytetrahydrobiopterin dehydratase